MDNNNLYQTQVEILQAFQEGKTIEYQEYFKDNWTAIDKSKNPDHLFDFLHNYYRVKPNTLIRPYKSKEEFVHDAFKHNFLLACSIKSGDVVFQHIIDILQNSVILFNSSSELHEKVSFNYLKENYYWADDNSKCAVIEESNQ